MSESSETLYRAIFEASPDGVLVVDDQGVILDANPKVEDLFEYPRNDLLGEKVEILVPDAVRPSHSAHRERFVGEAHARPMGIGLDLRGRRRSGEEFPVEISLSPLPTADGTLVIATVRDMSHRQRLRDFGTGALRASEDERQRIARELHDDTAQHLASLLVQIEVLQRTQGPVVWSDHLETFRNEIKACADGVRRIARGLRPPELEDAGVVAALRSHLRSVRDATRLEVQMDLDPIDPLLDVDGKLVLYRIIQEAVSNATRHAGAGILAVRVERFDGKICAEVRDDGRGFEPGIRSGAGGGLGLVGMQERAVMAGGRVAVESAPGKGTTVRVCIPIASSALEALEVEDGNV